MKMSPVTDLYTGFTYVNEEIYKLYAENRSEPIFWNIRLSSNQEVHINLYDSLNKCLNTTYFHSMNISFSAPKFYFVPECSNVLNQRVLADLSLENTQLNVIFNGIRINKLYGCWWIMQCDLLKSINQEEVYPCQVYDCQSTALVLDGQCKIPEVLVLAFPVTSFLDIDPVRLFNYTKCFLNEHANLHVNKSSKLPVIYYLMLRKEKHIIFTLNVYVNYFSNYELEHFPHIMNMTWSIFTLIKHFKLNNQKRSSLLEKQLIGLDSKNVCFAFINQYMMIKELDSTDLVCSDVIVNETFIFDKKELQHKFICMQHLGLSEESLANDSSLVSKSAIAVGLLYFVFIRLCGVYAVAEH
ncbi:hypothetical protein BgiMline_012316 [Biomphalaria glabrata]